MINQKNNLSGFTLVELLLVMAIIGILAGVMMVGISASRKRARVAAVLKTANNVTTELAYCYLNNKTVGDISVGSQICSGAGNWPDISKHNCGYDGYTNGVLTISCPNDDNATITCAIKDGNCAVTY